MILTDSRSRSYDVSNDVMKFSISEISNDDISGTGRPIDFVFDSSMVFGYGGSNGATSDWTKSKSCRFSNFMSIEFVYFKMS